MMSWPTNSCFERVGSSVKFNPSVEYPSKCNALENWDQNTKQAGRQKETSYVDDRANAQEAGLGVRKEEVVKGAFTVLHAMIK